METEAESRNQQNRPVGRPPGSGRGRKRKHNNDDKQARPDTVRYHCDYCQKDISDVVRIRCAVCKDFDLCLECFSVGVEISDHKNDHAYKIMDYMSFPLFEEGWGADEELLLIEGIQMYGLGNWTDVADHVSTKSQDACREHYFKIYIMSPTSPLPDTSKLLTTNLSDYLRRRQALHPMSAHDDLSKSFGAGSSASGKGSKTNKKNTKPKHQNVSCPVAHTDLAGFMPKRLEFETEWNNDAELMIGDLVLEESDDEATLDLKYQVLDIYNRRLYDRYEKRKFVLDNDLLDLKKQSKERKAKWREEPSEERALHQTMRPFLQLSNRDEHEAFLDGLAAEVKLKRRISQLQMWRTKGIRTLSEGELYELERKRRDAEKTPGTATRAKERFITMGLGSGGGGGLSEGEAAASASGEGLALRGSRWLRREHLGLWPLNECDLKPKPGRKHAGLDLTNAPGLDLLSGKERELCTRARLYPNQYLLVKERLIHEALRQGGLLHRTQARKLVELDPAKTTKIFEFLEASGWINSK